MSKIKVWDLKKVPHWLWPLLFGRGIIFWVRQVNQGKCSSTPRLSRFSQRLRICRRPVKASIKAGRLGLRTSVDRFFFRQTYSCPPVTLFTSMSNSGNSNADVPPVSTSEPFASEEMTIPRDAAAPRIAPTATLSGRGLLMLLLAVCLFPLISLSLYAVLFGRAAQHTLPVQVLLDRRFVETRDGDGAVLTEVVVIENLADFDIPNLTLDLNGQYFLYQDSPLQAGETLVLPQQIFATKANQRFVPGRYPIDEVTVTGKLPSGARGVSEVLFTTDP